MSVSRRCALSITAERLTSLLVLPTILLVLEDAVYSSLSPRCSAHVTEQQARSGYTKHRHG